MENLYYILDTETQEVVQDNLTYDESMNWLVEFGVASKHIMIEKINTNND